MKAQSNSKGLESLRKKAISLFFFLSLILIDVCSCSKSKSKYIKEEFSPYVAVDIDGQLQLYERDVEDCPFYKSLEKDPQYYYYKDKWFIRY